MSPFFCLEDRLPSFRQQRLNILIITAILSFYFSQARILPLLGK